MLQEIKDAWKDTPTAEKCVLLADICYITFYILGAIFAIRDSNKNKYSKV